MQLAENRSQIWFKIFTPDGVPIDGTSEHWSFPTESEKGQLFTSQNQIGTWLVSNPKPFYKEDNLVYISELQNAPIIELPGIIWVHSARLLRIANAIDLKHFGIYS